MSDRVRGRPDGSPNLPNAPSEDTSKATSKTVGDIAQTQPDAGERDSYERQLPSNAPQATAQAAPSPLLGRFNAGKVQFTQDDLAYLAQTFASVLQQNPNAPRLLRARLFARAILKRNRLKHWFSETSEAEMEKLCDAIANALDGSPVFGQLVDNITADTTKLNG